MVQSVLMLRKRSVAGNQTAVIAWLRPAYAALSATSFPVMPTCRGTQQEYYVSASFYQVTVVFQDFVDKFRLSTEQTMSQGK